MKKEKINKFNKNYYLLGKNSDGQKVWLKEASFDCGWYWGIGYVETFIKPYNDILSHSHFDTLFLNNKIFESFKTYFIETPLNDDEIYKLLELMKTIYTLTKYQETIYMKGSHITFCQNEKNILEKIKAHYEELNEIIPDLLKEIYKILQKES